MSSLLCDFAEPLALECGAFIKQNFRLQMEKTWKEDNSPLTVTDTAINDLVIRRIAKKFPTHAVLAEEDNLVRDHAEYVWVCDPLDGTIPFSHGIPTCVFSLALVRNGVPTLGVVYDPFMDRLFSAEQGRGAYLKSHFLFKRATSCSPLHVSDTHYLEQGVVSIGYAHHHINLLGVIGALVEHKAIPINVCSNVYMGSLVAAGEAIGAFFSGRLPWDVAALKIIVEEAGGKVTDLWGNEQRYDQEINGAIISNGRVHDKLVELVHRHCGRQKLHAPVVFDFESLL